MRTDFVTKSPFNTLINSDQESQRCEEMKLTMAHLN